MSGAEAGRGQTPARIGVMGGTFDPVHYGHLVTAQEALAQFDLDRILFVPTGAPPHKSAYVVSPPEDRYLMTVIATASNLAFTVSRVEIDRTGTTYTIDTLAALRSEYGPSAYLFFITGADAVWEIVTWKDHELLGNHCEFIAATRPGYSLDRFMESHLLGGDGAPGYPKVHVMEVPALSISSSDIRRRVRENEAVRYLLPDGVVNYIRKCGFYR